MTGIGIPAGGARAAHVLLDAVVSQSGSSTPDENVRAMNTALAGMVGEGDDTPSPGDIVGASVVCVSWLVAHLAAATGRDAENVVRDMREFIEASTAKEGAQGVDRVDE
jgi:hypothetical protein